ncbi:MAG: serine acetyltransferase [Deltaproteobacteria bacterium]|jgi:serine O-acetyltransferase|nr:serine acetyltransferase [Deltaproteobacteria bacterium]
MDNIFDNKPCDYLDSETQYLTEAAPELEETVETLFNLRKELKQFEYVTSVPRPSFLAAKKIISLFSKAVFPGYFERQPMAADSVVKRSIGRLLYGLFDLLSQEICSAIRLAHVRYGENCVDCRRQGRVEAMAVIKFLPTLRKLMASDVLATKEGDPAAGDHLDQIILSYPGVYATMVYRLAHELWKRKVPFIPRILTEVAHSQTGIDIHPGANIGSSFFIDHGTGVVVGETTIIGERVRLYQGVTLGALSLPRDAGKRLQGAKRHPTLDDEVIVYSGATILGGQTVIGARSVVGGNVWLTESIPPDTKVFIKKPELVIVSAARPGFEPTPDEKRTEATN